MSSRIPYTHHHDYIRMYFIREHSLDLSRADVANLSSEEDELYATTLIHAIRATLSEYQPLQEIDNELFQTCQVITQNHLQKLTEEIFS